VRKKKRFIDRKNAATFALVHRSQRDPLAADGDAPQRVLLPIREEGDGSLEVLEARREEQRNFGVYFDDDYDYLQHLKDAKSGEDVQWAPVDGSGSIVSVPAVRRPRGGSTVASAVSSSSRASTSGINLPSSVFATDYEEEVGFLNKAAPRSGPLVGADDDLLEVLETLDDAYEVQDVVRGADLAKEFLDEDDEDGEEEIEVEEGDLDDILHDMVQGEHEPSRDDNDEQNGEGDEEERSDFSSDFGPDNDGDYEDDDSDAGGYGGHWPGRRPQRAEQWWERSSRFSQASMTSSVIPRSEQMATLDDRFEKFLDAYEDDNQGALDFDEIEGYRQEDGEVMRRMVDDFEKSQETERERPVIILPEDDGDEPSGEDKDLVEVEAKEKWDCQSILSTYSNIYHHPKLISEPSKKVRPIEISSKTGMPKDVLGKPGLTAAALRQLDAENQREEDGDLYETATLASRVSALSIRNKHETLEEKRDRKKAFKQMKKERREEKKATKQAFKEEKVKQEKEAINNKRNMKIV